MASESTTQVRLPSSSNIEVVLIAGPTKQNIVILSDIPVEKIVPKFVNSLGLPLRDAANNPFKYTLVVERTGMVVPGDQTLQAAGVRDGDKLQLHAQAVAVAPHEGAETLVPDALNSQLADILFVKGEIVYVPEDYVYRISDLRREEQTWFGVAFAFLTLDVGTVANWLAPEKINVNVASWVLFACLSVATLFFGYMAFRYKHQADVAYDEMKEKIQDTRKSVGKL
jgi:WXG100 protein secretion system (Wss), protein YukD